MLPSALVVLPSMPLTAQRQGGPQGAAGARAAAANRAASRSRRARRSERFLAGLWSEVLGSSPVGAHDDFFALGGNSITGAMLINRLQQELGEIVHVVVIFDAPTVARLAAYLAAQHAAGGRAAPGDRGARSESVEAAAGRVDEAMLAAVAGALIHEPPPLPAEIAAQPKNPPALFVLSPPRSGSTLLRVMLGGHPGLFAPPELELLEFDTLAERRDGLPRPRRLPPGGGDPRGDGGARGATPEEARGLVDGLGARGTTTHELYRLLQEWIGDRMLVDKTPTYAWSRRRCGGPRRASKARSTSTWCATPTAMIHSFEEARIDQIFFRAQEHRSPAGSWPR